MMFLSDLTESVQCVRLETLWNLLLFSLQRITPANIFKSAIVLQLNSPANIFKSAKAPLESTCIVEKGETSGSNIFISQKFAVSPLETTAFSAWLLVLVVDPPSDRFDYLGCMVQF